MSGSALRSVKKAPLWLLGMFLLLAVSHCDNMGEGENHSDENSSIAYSHNAGSDCLSCHSPANTGMEASKQFTAAGTIYSDLAGSAAAYGKIIVFYNTANTEITRAYSDGSGNFYTRVALPQPYLAKVDGGPVMITQPNSGSCNSSGCHDAGKRIYATATSHNAGSDCLSSGCHNSANAAMPAAKVWSMAGTLYSDSAGTAVSAGKTIVIYDSLNTEQMRLTTDSRGNFFTNSAIPQPYKISVVNGNSMTTQPNSGSCNSSACHSSSRAF